MQEEVSRLRAALTEQADNLKQERKEAEEKAWSYFRAELQRVAEHHNQVLYQDQATSPPESLALHQGEDKLASKEGGDKLASQQGEDKVDSSGPEVASQQIELEKQVQVLQAELEQVKSKHANRLAALQTHLHDKQQEMEDFKTKVMEYTQKQEQDSGKYMNTLKQQVESLNEELVENKKLWDVERQKLEEKIESLSSEVQTLRQSKLADDSKVAALCTKVGKYQETFVQLKDYYERREEFLQEKFRKHEAFYYDNRLKLKAALHALNEIEFPKLTGNMEMPTKDTT